MLWGYLSYGTEVIHGVLGGTVYVDFEMAMGTGGTTCGAYIADGVPFGNRLTYRNRRPESHVGIKGGKVVTTAATDEESRELLTLMGAPFMK